MVSQLALTVKAMQCLLSRIHCASRSTFFFNTSGESNISTFSASVRAELAISIQINADASKEAKDAVVAYVMVTVPFLAVDLIMLLLLDLN